MLIAAINAIARYRIAYPIINGLGTDTVPKGDTPNAPEMGDCISKAARRQSASLGMRRLVTMPTLTAVSFCKREPICSTQPPMKDNPYNPKTTPPVASPERKLEHEREMVMMSSDSR